jgi:hypothetical protein
MTQDTRKRINKEHRIWFQNIQIEFKENNQGCENILDLIEKKYKGDKDYWAKIARSCGVRCHKREGIYYIVA